MIDTEEFHTSAKYIHNPKGVSITHGQPIPTLLSLLPGSAHLTKRSFTAKGPTIRILGVGGGGGVVVAVFCGFF